MNIEPVIPHGSSVPSPMWAITLMWHHIVPTYVRVVIASATKGSFHIFTIQTTAFNLLHMMFYIIIQFFSFKHINKLISPPDFKSIESEVFSVTCYSQPVRYIYIPWKWSLFTVNYWHFVCLLIFVFFFFTLNFCSSLVEQINATRSYTTQSLLNVT
jgi:hypothetical protein